MYARNIIKHLLSLFLELAACKSHPHFPMTRSVRPSPPLGESNLMGPKKSVEVKFFTVAFFGVRPTLLITLGAICHSISSHPYTTSYHTKLENMVHPTLSIMLGAHFTHFHVLCDGLLLYGQTTAMSKSRYATVLGKSARYDEK